MTERFVVRLEKRQVTGKQVGRLRREGQVPGIVYGTGIDPIPVQADSTEFSSLYREVGTTTLLQLVVGNDRPRPAFIREIQRDTISLEILHVDFQVVDLARPITVAIPVVLIGEAPVQEADRGVVSQALEEVEVHCLPTDIPHHITVDLTVLEHPDQSIHVRDLSVPEAVQILTDPDTMVVYVATMRPVEEEEEEEVERLFELEEEAEEETREE